MGWLLALMLVNPGASEAANQVSGDAYYDAAECSGPPAGFEDFSSYDGLVLRGSLAGCLYTKVISTKETPGGVYLESGEEVFVGTLGDEEAGTFTTTYKFESRFDPNTGLQLHGRCQHPLVEGSGTGGFEGATGRLAFKDIIGPTLTTYDYRGHINVG